MRSGSSSAQMPWVSHLVGSTDGRSPASPEGGPLTPAWAKAGEVPIMGFEGRAPAALWLRSSCSWMEWVLSSLLPCSRQDQVDGEDRSGGGLDRPSLAPPLPNGDILANDDFNDRVIVIDPTTDKIVWQYGHTGIAGRALGYLYDPDDIDFEHSDSMPITHAATMGEP